MDLNTRTVVRPDRLPTDINTSAQNLEAIITRPDSTPYNCEKIVVPRGVNLEEIGSHKVVYSDLDYNGHANNAKYTVWALDALPFEYVQNHPIKRININFNREAHLGETVQLLHAEITPDIHLLEGRVGASQIFLIELTFAPSFGAEILSA